MERRKLEIEANRDLFSSEINDFGDLYSFEELEHEYLRLSKVEFIESAIFFCHSLNCTTCFLINEIISRGDSLGDYDRLIGIINNIVEKVSGIIEFDKNNYKLTNAEKNAIIDRELKALILFKEENTECVSNPDYPKWKCKVEEMDKWKEHPFYYIIERIKIIRDVVDYARFNAEQKQSLIDSFFCDKTKAVREVGAECYPLIQYMGATPSTIRRVLTSRQPYGGIKIPWKGNKKGDILLLCDTLGFSLKQINDCFSFADGKPVAKSNKLKLENKDLQQILVTIKIFMGKNLSENLL